ncbi:hypothetical protein VNO77_00535 [Canavalia gladiata]|uniref:Uncharacterized protein n=1 Tax=Canavalia gladiata TaxID=3824 RepID=A0AAN9MRB9_CANGL
MKAKAPTFVNKSWFCGSGLTSENLWLRYRFYYACKVQKWEKKKEAMDLTWSNTILQWHRLQRERKIYEINEVVP